MKKLFYLLSLALLSISFSCQQPEAIGTKIDWDKYGVPHISANNLDELFFAQGWAQMHNHANMIAKLYGTSRGKAAEYWGAQNMESDLIVHTLGFPQLADEWESKQDENLKLMQNAFVRGLNAYAEANPDAIDSENKAVLPFSTRDVNMHGMYVVFTRFIGGNDLGLVQQWPDMGSNAYAIAPKRSASGNAMLVQNPHLPWWNEFLFTEQHLLMDGKNMYGATLVGLPGIAIGFNDHLGWTHTNNTIDNADTYELTLDNGGYLLDGERKEFEQSSAMIKVKQEDGSLAEQRIPIMKSAHGPIVKQENGKALAIRMVGMDRPNMFLQWWKMINSSSFEEFESALKMAQLPFWNVMYADKKGDIFYLFNGLVPKRTEDAWSYWNRVIPGGKSADIWTEVHSYKDLPKIKNPEVGWLQNANDPPWTSTIPMTLNPDDYPGYMSPVDMNFRPQRSARMLLEDESITFDELVEYKLSTRLEFADRILDDLFKAIDESNSEKAKRAKTVLENWDREADADSKGMLLFYNWASKFNVWRNSNYSIPWNINNPNTTPDGIADPERAIQLLERSVTEIEGKFGALDTPWGDYYRIRYNGKDLPANGIDGSMGVFRVAWPGGGNEDNLFVGGGDSWVGVIEFGEKINAEVLLSYGNSTQKNSANNGDQLELFSKKELRQAWFYPEDVKAHTVRTEFLQEGKFTSMAVDLFPGNNK